VIAELTDEEKQARSRELQSWLEGKFPLQDNEFESFRLGFEAKAAELGMEVTRFERVGDTIQTKVDFPDPRRELQQLLWRPTKDGIEVVDEFPKDAQYRDAVEYMQRRYGTKLGLFLANRFAKMIRKRRAECISDVRICCITDPVSVQEFERIRAGGCCGSAEAEFVFDGRCYRIGFNYGH
jgi:hypothetical protein